MINSTTVTELNWNWIYWRYREIRLRGCGNFQFCDVSISNYPLNYWHALLFSPIFTQGIFFYFNIVRSPVRRIWWFLLRKIYLRARYLETIDVEHQFALSAIPHRSALAAYDNRHPHDIFIEWSWIVYRWFILMKNDRPRTDTIMSEETKQYFIPHINFVCRSLMSCHDTLPKIQNMFFAMFFHVFSGFHHYLEDARNEWPDLWYGYTSCPPVERIKFRLWFVNCPNYGVILVSTRYGRMETLETNSKQNVLT